MSTLTPVRHGRTTVGKVLRTIRTAFLHPEDRLRIDARVCEVLEKIFDMTGGRLPTFFNLEEIERAVTIRYKKEHGLPLSAEELAHDFSLQLS